MKYNIKKITDNAYSIADLERAISVLRAENTGLNRALEYAQDRAVKDKILLKDINDQIKHNQSEIEKYEKQIKQLSDNIGNSDLMFEIEHRADYLRMNTNNDGDYEVVVEFGRLQHIWGATK